MNKVDGLHHLAICTGDMKLQIQFFSDVLGMELVALYWMHGVENTWHGFLRLNDESSVAFVQNEDIRNIPPQLGVTHAGNPAANSSPGTMQHVALRVGGDDELLAMRDRIRSKGVPVLGPIDHGLCKSIYFAGPENLSLELSYSTQPIDAHAWIDPEVVELAGISTEELAQFTQPADYLDEAGSVSQPKLDSPGPHMSNYPEGLYAQLLSTPDEAILAASQSAPPVTP
ncbi:MAG: VOC family protein [Gammaproteobacteria bacterium]|nr:VOC family protein [Gammaproteobacteria bacterium]